MLTVFLVASVFALTMLNLHMISNRDSVTKLFEGTYWSKDNKLKNFKVRASSKYEALETLNRTDDFKLVCEWCTK